MIDAEQYENNSKLNSTVTFTFFGKYSLIFAKYNLHQNMAVIFMFESWQRFVPLHEMS